MIGNSDELDKKRQGDDERCERGTAPRPRRRLCGSASLAETCAAHRGMPSFGRDLAVQVQ
jgi:hypothetical protein